MIYKIKTVHKKFSMIIEVAKTSLCNSHNTCHKKDHFLFIQPEKCKLITSKKVSI